MTKDAKQWYASWFDTPFYHILYKDRGHGEAEAFMANLTAYLNLPENGRILDLACGKGRHAVYLNSIGFDVTGVDLSENSIAHAKHFENETLHFEVHDMCQPYPKQFDAVFNLFTSFGYFEREEDDLATIKAIKTELNAVGFGVIDFMNVDFVATNLIAEDVKIVDGISFILKRYIKDGFVYKDIDFEYEGEDYSFTEKVKAFRLQDFELLFEQAGVTLLDVFGDYKLNRFHKGSSERLIMIFK
jgi:SAM-dependent methyltransferase